MFRVWRRDYREHVIHATGYMRTGTCWFPFFYARLSASPKPFPKIAPVKLIPTLQLHCPEWSTSAQASSMVGWYIYSVSPPGPARCCPGVLYPLFFSAYLVGGFGREPSATALWSPSYRSMLWPVSCNGGSPGYAACLRHCSSCGSCCSVEYLPNRSDKTAIKISAKCLRSRIWTRHGRYREALGMLPEPACG